MIEFTKRIRQVFPSLLHCFFTYPAIVIFHNSRTMFPGGESVCVPSITSGMNVPIPPEKDLLHHFGGYAS
jgi:hypothetical protein